MNTHLEEKKEDMSRSHSLLPPLTALESKNSPTSINKLSRKSSDKSNEELNLFTMEKSLPLVM
jgi:hypothetical protein